jgi:hypothetical protein
MRTGASRPHSPLLGPRRWLWALAVVAVGALTFFAVQGAFRLVAAVGVVVALVALLRAPGTKVR